jgi:RNA polymerase primary sigma factor
MSSDFLVNLLMNGKISPVEGKRMKREMAKILSGLTPRQKRAVCLRFGLESNLPSTLKEVAEIMNFSTQRASQIVAAALRKMRLFIRNNY